MPRQACISVTLMSLDGLDTYTLDLGNQEDAVQLLKSKVVNNSKFSVNDIKDACSGSNCMYFYRIITVLNNPKFCAAVDPWRAVNVIFDGSDKKCAVEFMKHLRTW